MPIFEFYCEQCGKSFEELLPSAASEVSCPECGNPQVKRKISTFAAKVAGGKSTSYWGNPTASSCSTRNT